MNNHTKSEKKGYLTLSTGEVFEGQLYGTPTTANGEVVFHTGMTGYQEVLGDPGYAGQIVTLTYPLIGNYGITEVDYTSLQPALSGLLVSELCDQPSHYSSTHSLSELAERYGFPVLSGIDTRAITKLVRSSGELFGIIGERPLTVEEVAAAKAKTDRTSFNQQPLVSKVSGKEIITYDGGQEHIVVIDLGMRRSILNWLLAEGCRVTVVPYHTTFEQIKALHPDALVYSNGPGDPTELMPFHTEWRPAIEIFPTFGIGLGQQVLAQMFGAKTERLPYGHRGSNHPVKELATGKVYMTSQNHGYAIKEETIDLHQLAITYRNVNDGSVEGLRHLYLPISGVQFHPEGHPRASDTTHVFAQFLKSLQVIGAKQHA